MSGNLIAPIDTEMKTQRLEAKQYIPLSNQHLQDGDITIIGACATSFPKEVYEPLWNALLQQCESRCLRIRSIWMAEKGDHAARAPLNEDTMLDDQSPNDLALDLLHMVKIYRDEFKPPIVGFGHSMHVAAGARTHASPILRFAHPDRSDHWPGHLQDWNTAHIRCLTAARHLGLTRRSREVLPKLRSDEAMAP